MMTLFTRDMTAKIAESVMRVVSIPAWPNRNAISCARAAIVEVRGMGHVFPESAWTESLRL